MIPSWIMMKGEHRNTFDRMVRTYKFLVFFDLLLMYLFRNYGGIGVK